MPTRLGISGFRISILLVLMMLNGCSSLSYYSHLLSGQMSLLWNREPVKDLLDAEETSEKLKKRLALSQELREFASETLKLPVGNAYTSYTDLMRPYAVWNIYAAPELSLESHTWCYPVVGCLAYRGYFDPEWAKSDAAKLEEKGLETRVGGVRAYSTLGVFDDPLLSSFIFSEEAYLIELLIHEISHRKLYIEDDTKFNENFATAVGTLGAELWYRQRKQDVQFHNYQKSKLERKKLISFVLNYKEKLNALYRQEQLDVDMKREAKRALLNEMRLAYQDFKFENKWDDRYDHWINNLNNAGFSTLSNYQDLVPGFIALYHQVGDWEAFYKRVEALSRKSKIERHEYLSNLARSTTE